MHPPPVLLFFVVVVFPKDLEFLVSQARNVSPSGQLEVSVRGGAFKGTAPRDFQF
jgi:hypothetical protein